MRDINKITTEQLREASSKGFVASLGYRSIADNEFDYWLVRERNRVAELAKAKERERILSELRTILWQSDVVDFYYDYINFDELDRQIRGEVLEQN